MSRCAIAPLLSIVLLLGACQAHRQPPGTTDLLVVAQIDRQVLRELSQDQYGKRSPFQEGAGLQMTTTEVYLRAVPDDRRLRVQERQLSWGANEVSLYFPPGTAVLLQLRSYGALRARLDLGQVVIDDSPNQFLAIDLPAIYRDWRQDEAGRRSGMAGSTAAGRATPAAAASGGP